MLHEHLGHMNRTILPMILSLQLLSMHLRSGDTILWVLSVTFALTIRCWLELIKDYDLEMHYHPGKANVVADALSRKAHCHCFSIEAINETLYWEMRKLNLEIIPQGSLNHIAVEPTLQDSIIRAQLHDEGVKIIKQQLAQGEEKYKCFQVDHKEILWFKGRIVVPKDHQLRKQILNEAHLSKFSMHPGTTKMYQDLRQNFWWTRMKREIARYVSECDICQRVKASHLKIAGSLQPLPIPSWKWENISIDFIVGLPNTSQRHDSIWVIVDRLTNVTVRVLAILDIYFVSVNYVFVCRKLVCVYVKLLKI
jgi:hypothetical protein